MKSILAAAAVPLAIVAGASALGGCSEVRQAIGAEKTSPDEFEIRVRKPLSMPREYGLAAPSPGAKRPQETASRDAARQIVLESDPSRTGNRSARAQIRGVSQAEAALLARVGGTTIDADIRRRVDRESEMIAENNKSFVDSIMFWKEEDPPGTAVDPQKEARRIQENAALGRKADTGKTPIIERKKKGLFSSSFLTDWF
ncbi:MAG: DUF3035 domain-containing protein [Alphaproteobacteria bacterium]|nr:DUF3035 domain-containing protein [Alphaproteobacteria bacterium]